MKYLRALIFAFAALFVLSASAQSDQTPDRAADHEALRAILAKGMEALNTRNFDLIAPSLHPKFTAITVDNKKLVGLDAFKKNYLSLFEGENAKLDRIDTNIVADEATTFLDDNTGVVYGTSDDAYHFKDGDVRKMKTRWSAVMQKEADGWKLVNIHFSADLLNNPVLSATQSFSTKAAIGAAVAGLILGMLIMMFLRRRQAR